MNKQSLPSISVEIHQPDCTKSNVHDLGMYLHRHLPRVRVYSLRFSLFHEQEVGDLLPHVVCSTPSVLAKFG